MNLVFASNIIYFFLFLIIDLYFTFLIPAVITQIFIAAAELAIPTGLSIKEPKTEIKARPVNTEARINKCSV